jgi:adenylyltransferase/sulfurtransferase
MKAQNQPIDVQAKSQKKEDRDSNFQLLSWWKSDVVQQAKVMVVGAGAIGNEVLKNLALMNVGHILIVDFDHIEYSNLAKSVLFREKDCERKTFKCEIAAERIKEINPDVKVKTINGDLRLDVGLGVIRRMDAIIGCLDNRTARLTLNQFCFKNNKPWIDGAIEDLITQVNVFKPEISCYECGLTDLGRRNLERNSCAMIYQNNIKSGRIPTTPLSSSISAALQVQEALKIIHGYDDALMLEESFYMDGMRNLVLQRKPKPLKEHCQSHQVYEEIISSPLKSSNTIQDFFDWIVPNLNCENPVILLDNDVALELGTMKSNKLFKTVIPTIRLEGERLKEFQVHNNEAVKVKEQINKVFMNFDRKELTLKAIGVPELHIVRVAVKGEIKYVELSGDEDFLFFS